MKNTLYLLLLVASFSQCKKSATELSPDPAILVAGTYNLTFSSYMSKPNAFGSGSIVLERVNPSTVRAAFKLDHTTANEVWELQQITEDSVTMKLQSLDNYAFYSKKVIEMTLSDGSIELKFTKK